MGLSSNRYQRCFSGDTAAEWIADVIYAKEESEEKALHAAALTMRELIKEGLVHHPCRNIGMRPHEYYQLRELTSIEVTDYVWLAFPIVCACVCLLMVYSWLS